MSPPQVSGTRLPEQQATPPPEIGSAPGWPLVLYFHHVHPDIRHYTALTPGDFDLGLARLGERFRPLEPTAVPSVVAAGGHTEPGCLLTFDDGYADVFEHALPLMEQRGWRSVVFVSVDLVGQVEQHPVRGPLRHMTWAQLAELTRRGHVVASHATTHVPLNTLADDAAVQAEIDRAQEVLAERLPGAPDWLAYPFGELPSGGPRLPSLCFGSVKAPARPWHTAPHEIRRTYLPAGETQRWDRCLSEWRKAWESGVSR
ncbi:polysaccharide deacetylase [Actinobacteria bacterium OK074]|nr:polysaccharide deacetylase [Actinobacteria bacterium OK074]